MAGRKIKDSADARKCLSAAAASGLTDVEWARKRGIDGRSLNAWRMNLARRGAALGPRRKRTSKGKSGPARLVELVAAPGAASAEASPARYVVWCGELTVELDERFEDATLRRLLRVVSSC